MASFYGSLTIKIFVFTFPAFIIMMKNFLAINTELIFFIWKYWICFLIFAFIYYMIFFTLVLFNNFENKGNSEFSFFNGWYNKEQLPVPNKRCATLQGFEDATICRNLKYVLIWRCPLTSRLPYYLGQTFSGAKFSLHF